MLPHSLARVVFFALALRTSGGRRLARGQARDERLVPRPGLHQRRHVSGDELLVAAAEVAAGISGAVPSAALPAAFFAAAIMGALSSQ